MFKTTKNLKPVKLSEIPVVAVKELRPAVIAHCKSGKRAIAMFGVKEGGSIKVYIVLADDDASVLYISSCVFDNGASYPCFTVSAPQFHMFERELYEETGIKPEGHPWLKPVRYSHNRNDKKSPMESYPFFRVTGEDAHEVAVGPVHAGVIEPGHFRFMCAGEKIMHLEIQLGYQHRAVEKLFEENGAKAMPQLAEQIAGDTSIGHAMAYCGMLEALAGEEAPKRAQIIRAIALELERAAMHTGGLSALANDIAYLLGNAVFGANRTTLINTSLLICGSRFGRGLVRPGGAAFDISPEKAIEVVKNTDAAFANIERMAEKMFTSASVLSRFEKTGIVTKAQAADAGLTGFAARASGVLIDLREDHPHGAYKYFAVRKQSMPDGDVFARAYLRYMEIRQSVELIKEMAQNLATGPVSVNIGVLQPDSLAISMTEGWRGGIVHIGITDDKGAIKRLKIKDPSFNNWYGLALAVRGNGISDFPLCNKSFDLSYCGNDL